MTKHFEPRYRLRAPEIRAIRWTEDTPLADLHDFTDGGIRIIRLDDETHEFAVFIPHSREWQSFDYGDWVGQDYYTVFTMSHDEFVRTYEEVSNGEHT